MAKSYCKIVLNCIIFLSSGMCYSAQQGDQNSDIRELFASIKRLRDEEEESVKDFSKYLYAIKVCAPEDVATKQHLLDCFLTWQHMRSRTNTQVDAVEKLVIPRGARAEEFEV